MAGGEVDVRGCYTAMAAAHLAGLDAAALAQHASLAAFVTACQVRRTFHCASFFADISSPPPARLLPSKTAGGMLGMLLFILAHVRDIHAYAIWEISGLGCCAVSGISNAGKHLGSPSAFVRLSPGSH